SDGSAGLGVPRFRRLVLLTDLPAQIFDGFPDLAARTAHSFPSGARVSLLGPFGLGPPVAGQDPGRLFCAAFPVLGLASDLVAVHVSSASHRCIFRAGTASRSSPSTERM